VPEWAKFPDVWEQAFRLLDREPPPYRGVFLHRDFHAGNVLWQQDIPSGVVDWVETSWGPSSLDVAHCSTYLAMLHGRGVAERFVQAYRALDPDAEDPDEARYWSVMDIVGYLPGPSKMIEPWRALGRHVDEAEAARRLEELLAVTLGC
jgi:aminoglycoside phosphotransferase (APT) family kinase protein